MKLLTSALLAATLLATPALAAEAPAKAKPAAANKAAPKKPVAPKEKLPANAERFDHGRFTGLIAYRPEGTPKTAVLFLSGDNGWTASMQDMAQLLAHEGALVIGIDTPSLIADFNDDGGDCVFPDGDLENLAHFAEAYYKVPGYIHPIIAGWNIGSTLAYATLAQAPKDVFAGALTLGFSPQLPMKMPLCAGTAVAYASKPDGSGLVFKPAKTIEGTWIALLGRVDQVVDVNVAKAFVDAVPGASAVLLDGVGHGFSVPARWTQAYVEAFHRLADPVAAAAPPPVPAELGDLPIVEVAAKGTGTVSTNGQTFAVLLSGDGGWAGLDQDVADALSKQGIPVVGVDSLRYYWSPRTPEGLAADLDKIVRYYQHHWNRSRALLIGYSQGADVLPFALNRMPAATLKSVALGAVMGLGENATFEFHMSNWVSDDDNGPPTQPEMEKVATLGIPMLCIYGEDEDDTVCPKLNPQKVRIVKLPGGHHFGGDYARLAQEILTAAKPAP